MVLAVANQDTQLITVLSGVIVPLLVGVLAKAQAPAGLKAILNAALSAVGAALSQIIPGAFEWVPFIVAWATTWVISVATHFGFYKPVGVTQAVQSSTAGVGLG